MSGCGVKFFVGPLRGREGKVLRLAPHAAVRAAWWEVRQRAGWVRPGPEAEPLKKGAYVLPPACAGGSKTGKWLELLCMRTAAFLSSYLFIFFSPTTALHYPASRCIGRKLERAINSTLLTRGEGGGKGKTKLPAAFWGWGMAQQSALSCLSTSTTTEYTLVH